MNGARTLACRKKGSSSTVLSTLFQTSATVLGQSHAEIQPD